MVGSGFRRVLIKEQRSQDTVSWDLSRSFQTFQVFEVFKNSMNRIPLEIDIQYFRHF